MTLAIVLPLNPDTFLAIVGAAAVSGTLAALLAGRGIVVPVVVIELIAGVLIGPHVAGLVPDEFVDFFRDLGLGLLFFFAGYEIDLRRIEGHPARLALIGWAISLAIAYTVGGVLAATGIVLSLVYTGSALATTAIGALIPMLSDSGELTTTFGTYLLAAGAVGEFGPIVLLTLVLSSQSVLRQSLILLAFIALAVTVAVLTVRSATRTLPLFERTLESSSQLAVRWIVVLVFALALLAYHLGLDLLLGGFAAGLITREVLKTKEIPAFDSKLTAIAFGVFVPFFFIVSGMDLDVSAIFASVSGVIKTLMFFVLCLVVRGTPALLLYRRVLDRRHQTAMALLTSTQLPLVLAITTLAVSDGHMRPSTAAALVGGAVLSTLVYPILGLRVLGDLTAVAEAEGEVKAEADARTEAEAAAPSPAR
jgi:Kef-type K+ transport system membrane component KefB